jgi:hypothetical protein
VVVREVGGSRFEWRLGTIWEICVLIVVDAHSSRKESRRRRGSDDRLVIGIILTDLLGGSWGRYRFRKDDWRGDGAYTCTGSIVYVVSKGGNT